MNGVQDVKGIIVSTTRRCVGSDVIGKGWWILECADSVMVNSRLSLV